MGAWRAWWWARLSRACPSRSTYPGKKEFPLLTRPQSSLCCTTHAARELWWVVPRALRDMKMTGDESLPAMLCFIAHPSPFLTVSRETGLNHATSLDVFLMMGMLRKFCSVGGGIYLCHFNWSYKTYSAYRELRVFLLMREAELFTLPRGSKDKIYCQWTKSSQSFRKWHSNWHFRRMLHIWQGSLLKFNIPYRSFFFCVFQGTYM